MIKEGFYVVNCEFGMILIWTIHERLDIYVVMNLVWAMMYIDGWDHGFGLVMT